jgi:hypothetical protein
VSLLPWSAPKRKRAAPPYVSFGVQEMEQEQVFRRRRLATNLEKSSNGEFQKKFECLNEADMYILTKAGERRWLRNS